MREKEGSMDGTTAALAEADSLAGLSLSVVISRL